MRLPYLYRLFNMSSEDLTGWFGIPVPLFSEIIYHGWPSQRKASGTNPQMKARAENESDARPTVVQLKRKNNFCVPVSRIPKPAFLFMHCLLLFSLFVGV